MLIANSYRIIKTIKPENILYNVFYYFSNEIYKFIDYFIYIDAFQNYVVYFTSIFSIHKSVYKESQRFDKGSFYDKVVFWACCYVMHCLLFTDFILTF